MYLVHFDICCHTRMMPCSYKIFHTPSSLFHKASWISSLISKLNLLLSFLLMNPRATTLTFSPFHNTFLRLSGKSSLHLSDPRSQLITRLLLSLIFPSSGATVVTNGTRSISGSELMMGGAVWNEIIAIKSDPYAGVFWVCVGVCGCLAALVCQWMTVASSKIKALGSACSTEGGL